MKRLAPVFCFLLFSQATAAHEQVPLGARCLISSYPDVVCGYSDNEVQFCDKSTLPYDDGVEKTAQRAIENPDIEDHFKFHYPKTFAAPTFESDPGRTRHDPFGKLYGTTKKKVQKSITTVDWFGAKVQLTSEQNVAARFQRARDEIAQLPKDIRRMVEKPSGGFVWRNIKGTKRRSAHSYGIAVDVGVSNSDYWKWNKPVDGKYQYKNRIPHEVVQIFEKHGFIWGGKWYHYDTMHFEYRPEILCVANAD